MAGLDPAIHVLLNAPKDVDARVKPAHDAWWKRDFECGIANASSLRAKRSNPDRIRGTLRLDCFVGFASSQ
jgi:hypothetical protein